MPRLSAASKSKPFTPKLLDRFTIEGPNGSRPYLVTTPASSLVDAKLASTSHLFQLSAAWSLATQSIMAIAHVHSLGYAHGNANVLISDFGDAFRPEDKTTFKSNAPSTVRVPEADFEPTMPLTQQSEIWSLGCAIFELFAHRTLFSYIIPYAGRITAQQVHLSGSFIGEWLDKWEGREKYFNEDLKQLTDPRFIYPWSKCFTQWIQQPKESNDMEILALNKRLHFLTC
ncbi:hypothetical protein LZL87_013025 [Fusarium oxysporum]|nr:hypothetical protein LZL87_013025 [Fusarium oxysporum]